MSTDTPTTGWTAAYRAGLAAGTAEMEAAFARMARGKTTPMATVPRYPTGAMFAAAIPLLTTPSQDLLHEIWRLMIAAWELEANG